MRAQVIRAGCPLPNPGFVCPGSGCCRGFHKATSSKRIQVCKGDSFSPVRCNVILPLSKASQLPLSPWFAPGKPRISTIKQGWGPLCRQPLGKAPSGAPGSGLPALPSSISRLRKIPMEQQSLQKAEGGGWRGRAVPQGPGSV